ncbi:MAG: pseudouridine-5-phosphate glycosidase [Gammaproteobacteria bacterium]|nr:MAG: pseudouridine-5-phosphate glycosidase [Gammaproteobacteria bacterium]
MKTIHKKNQFNPCLDISTTVQQALDENRPVVALESTIISHGMPYPQNAEMAREVEKIVRENGAIPATIAIIGGRIKVGLHEDDLEHLAKTGLAVTKVSRRDLPFVVAQSLDGATTVASTMIIAEMAGIELFVTGGIGGVHRGASESFDISADLQELAQTNVGVVCAGAKSILDIGLTLEYLETHGVPVIGYATEDFPAFYTPTSGFKVDYRLDSAEAIANALRTKWHLGLSGGVVIANPIPAEQAMDKNNIDQAITTALKEADEQGIRGKASTPFLLDRVKSLTGGDSLAANIALVYHNAKVGAQIAAALAKNK